MSFQFFCLSNDFGKKYRRQHGEGGGITNTVAEPFFSLLKKNRVKRRVYKTRDDARSEIFDCIEWFYNPRRNHGTNNRLSPEVMEKQYFSKLQGL